MNNAATLTTSDLFIQTELHLVNGQWGKARALLDDLSRRNDIRGTGPLADCAFYERNTGKSLHPEYRQLIQDRIDAVNARI
jgi:hypothetical protein